MKNKTNIPALCLLLACTTTCFGQGYVENRIIDSLKKELAKDNLHDTAYINLLSEIGEQTPIFRITYWDTIANLAEKAMSDGDLTNSDPITKSLKTSLSGALNNIGYIHDNQGDIPLALDYYHKSLKIREEIKDKAGMANSYNNIGYIHHNQGDIPLALDYFHKSLKIREEIKDKAGMANSYNNIGLIHHNQGDIPLALDYYHKSLKLREEIKDKRGMAESYNNIGYIHKNQGDIPLALDYYHKSLKIQEEIKDKAGMANSYNNIGLIHKNQGDIPLALDYYHKSLKIREEIKDKAGMANSYHNIGAIHYNQGDIPLALDYFHKSLKIQEEIKDKAGMAYSYNSIGTLHLKAGAVAEARKMGETGLQLARELGFPEQIERNAGLLSKVARKEKKFEEALVLYELHVQYRDSVINKENEKAAIRQQTKYEFEKQQLIREQEEKERQWLEAETTQRRDNLQYSILLIGILLVFGGVMSLGFLKVSPRIAEGLIFFAFLIFFEFLLVFIDPYIEGVTGGAPAWKLLSNAVIAALIFPLHAFFERLLKKRLLKAKRKKVEK